jgi:hypothetical protein
MDGELIVTKHFTLERHFLGEDAKIREAWAALLESRANEDCDSSPCVQSPPGA